MNASVTAPAGVIEWLGEVQAAPDALGGKAASLDRLARLGFPIPPGFCITTAAFAAHLGAIAEERPFAIALAGLPDEQARITVTDLVRETPLPARVRSALRIALGRLEAAGETSLAVRSSAVGEDGRVASFAGLHETELGLATEEV